MEDNVKPITEIPSATIKRIPTGLPDMDFILGGGFVPGQCMLLAGEPGAGKSTMLMQLSSVLASHNRKVLYASGEESLEQVKLRADRLGTLSPNMFCSENIGLEELIRAAEELQPEFLIVDSLQMLHSVTLKSATGSPTQMRYAMDNLISWSKRTRTVLIVVGHATKAGAVAGMNTLQHMVDTVWFLTSGVDTKRGVYIKKNRFGEAQTGLELHMGKAGFAELKTHEKPPEPELLKESSEVKSLVVYKRHGLVFNTIKWTLAILCFPFYIAAKAQPKRPRRMLKYTDLNI